MASIVNNNGLRSIFFFDKDGKRKAFRLGRVSKEQALYVKVRLLDLIKASTTGSSIIKDETARWLAERDDRTYARLVELGLAQPRVKVEPLRGPSLGTFIDGYIKTRLTVKFGTIHSWKMTRRDLVQFWGEDKDITAITAGDVDEWADKMRAKYAAATAGRRAGIAKQFFRWGRRKKILVENPFEDIKTSCPANEKRRFFVTRDMAQKVLDACPDAQWRLIFALCRFGGLRCPSEVLTLRWADVDYVDWKQMTVHSPKTEHHGGDHVERIVPIFPELRRYFRECYDQAAPGSEYVITRYRDTSANLRTQFCRILRKAGLLPWPKLFVNLRSTCETELVRAYPVHLVCKWLGHNALIANKHYLQVTEEDIERAAREGALGVAKSGAEGPESSHFPCAVMNAVHARD